MKNLTALVSCFARAYHTKQNTSWIFYDPAAPLLLGKDYHAIAQHLITGRSFFLPDFDGSDEQALEKIVNETLAPAVLLRSAFCKRAFETEKTLGCRQIVQFAAGYDSFFVTNQDESLQLFELDKAEILADKRCRAEAARLEICQNYHAIACDLCRPDWIADLQKAGFCQTKKAFGSLLGLSYYLPKKDFAALLQNIGSLWCPGSVLVMDIPTAGNTPQAALAAAANEHMQASYTEAELEQMLQSAGFLLYEYLTPAEAEAQLITPYTGPAGADKPQPPTPLHAPENVCYCLAVKK